ncbi:MAG: hypothetical protein QOJ79_1568 [Actinomycetota bacterium]|nr:hypothetical protein [Actinomycetota bacterium]
MEPAITTARRGALLLAAEGVALLVVGIVLVVATVGGSPDNRGLSYGVAGFALAGGAVLLLLARAVDRRQGWARSPAVVLQLLAVPVGIGFLQGGHWAVGVPVLLCAVATFLHVIRTES